MPAMVPPRGVVHIVIDHREQASGVPGALKLRDDVDVSFAQLSVGDYVVDDNVVFERKTINDFATSLLDARLFRQATRLARVQMPKRTAFIIEGGFSQCSVAVSRESMQGALISLVLVFGIPVLRSTGADETARLIVYAGRQLADQDQGAIVWRNRKPKRMWNRRLHILQSLPGVGRERAIRLLEHFGTVERCLRADVAELCQVEGIGAKTAREIRQLVG